MYASSVTSLTINTGTFYAVFAYDIGWAINLENVNRRITADRARGRLQHKTRAPQYFEYRPAPLPYNSRRLMPSSFANSTMFSQWFSRSTAICRKTFGNLPTRFLATCHPLLVSSVPIPNVSI